LISSIVFKGDVLLTLGSKKIKYFPKVKFVCFTSQFQQRVFVNIEDYYLKGITKKSAGAQRSAVLHGSVIRYLAYILFGYPALYQGIFP
jgi:hypothetical protein